VLLPHVVGSADTVMMNATSWQNLADHTQNLVAFGGLPLKNSAVSPGGTHIHEMRGWLETLHARGAHIFSISPLEDDIADSVGAEWIAPRPGTDVALMLGLAHVLITESLLDEQFLERYCVGY